MNILSCQNIFTCVFCGHLMSTVARWSPLSFVCWYCFHPHELIRDILHEANRYWSSVAPNVWDFVAWWPPTSPRGTTDMNRRLPGASLSKWPATLTIAGLVADGSLALFFFWKGGYSTGLTYLGVQVRLFGIYWYLLVYVPSGNQPSN